MNTRDLDGRTALFPAVFSGNVRMIELLVAHGAEVNVRNKAGATPLDLGHDLESKQRR